MKETSGLKKIISTLIVIVMISAMAGMVCFAQTRPQVSAFIAGAFFFFVGVLGIVNNRLTLENSFILIFPFAGALIMLIAASFIWDVPFLAKIRENIEVVFPIVVLAFFFCIGAGMFFGSIVYRKKKKENCTYSVQAQCIDLRKKSDSDGDLYSPVYQYYYNGREYIYKSKVSSNAKPPELYGYYEIKINPENPEDIWFPNRAVIGPIVGIMLMVVSILIAFSLLK